MPRVYQTGINPHSSKFPQTTFFPNLFHLELRHNDEDLLVLAICSQACSFELRKLQLNLHSLDLCIHSSLVVLVIIVIPSTDII
jgi:hypothetical protein